MATPGASYIQALCNETGSLDNASKAAGTFRYAVDVTAWNVATFQWIHRTATGACSAINFYVSAAPIELLADLDPSTNPHWKADSRIAFATLPTAAIGGSIPLQIRCPGYSMIMVEVVVSVDITGLSIYHLGKS